MSVAAVARTPTSEGTGHLVALQRLDSQLKRHRVIATLSGFVGRGEIMPIVCLARRAGVSPRFVYNHPELRAEIERRAAEIGDQIAGRVTASASRGRRSARSAWRDHSPAIPVTFAAGARIHGPAIFHHGRRFAALRV